MIAEIGHFALVLAFVAGGLALTLFWLMPARQRRAANSLMAEMPYLHLSLAIVAAVSLLSCIATQDRSVAAIAAHGTPDFSPEGVWAFATASRSAALLAGFLAVSLAGALLFTPWPRQKANAIPAIAQTANLAALALVSSMLLLSNPFERAEPTDAHLPTAMDPGPSVLAIGQALPAFELPALAGSGKPALSSADLLGHITLVNIFASWCPSCLEEHPELMSIAMSGEYRLAAINWRDKPGEGARFLAVHGNPYIAIADDPGGGTGTRLGVTGVPETLVIDKQGILRHRIIGPLTDELWRNEILPLVERLRRVP